MKSNTTRALTVEEYKKIIPLIRYGFHYEDDKGNERKFMPNPRIAFILQLQATLGLRIGDVLDLKPKHFKGDKIEIIENKTKKMQNRKVNPEVVKKIFSYALENNIKEDELLFDIGVRAVQKQLKIATDYLGLNNIGTHSFRKLYATNIYNETKDIGLVRELLNHDKIDMTERYIDINQEKKDKVSQEVNMFIE